jgi:hypothetical protein
MQSKCQIIKAASQPAIASLNALFHLLQIGTLSITIPSKKTIIVSSLILWVCHSREEPALSEVEWAGIQGP